MSGAQKATVTLSMGEVEGVCSEGLCVFKGVPYAAAPVGSRRWMPPQPVEPWQGTYRADRFRGIAPQNLLIGGPTPEKPEPQDEDCLYLNIYSPGLDDARRPVMVWIHGGAFSFGSGSSAMSDGSRSGQAARRGGRHAELSLERAGLLESQRGDGRQDPGHGQ